MKLTSGVGFFEETPSKSFRKGVLPTNLRDKNCPLSVSLSLLHDFLNYDRKFAGRDNELVCDAISTLLFKSIQSLHRLLIRFDAKMVLECLAYRALLPSLE